MVAIARTPGRIAGRAVNMMFSGPRMVATVAATGTVGVATGDGVGNAGAAAEVGKVGIVADVPDEVIGTSAGSHRE